MALEEYPVNQVISRQMPIRDMVIGVNRPVTNDIAWLLIHAFPEMETDGTLRQVVVTFVDITDRKRAEGEVWEKAFMMDSVSAIIARSDLDGKLTYANPAFLDNCGYDSIEEVLGRPFTEFWMLGDKTKEVMTALVGDGASGRWSGELSIKRKDGSLLELLVSAATVYDSSGEPISLMSTSIDVTDRKRAEEALRESEMMTRSLLEGSPVCNKIIDLDFKLQYMSAAGVRDLKVPDIKPYYGKAYPLEIYPESVRAPLVENFKKAMAGETASMETPVHDMEGNLLCYHATFVPAYDDDGRVKYVIVTSVNITDRKRAEEELRVKMGEIEKHNRFMIGREGRIVEVKREVNALLREMGREVKYGV